MDSAGPEVIPAADQGSRRAEVFRRIEHDLALRLTATVKLSDGLALCLEAALRAAELDAGGFYLRDEQTGDLELAVHCGLSPEFVSRARRFAAGTPQAELVLGGLPCFAVYRELARDVTGPAAREGLRFAGMVPLQHEGRVIGCLNVASHTQEDIAAWAREAVETIAANAAQAVARLQAEEKLRQERERLQNIIEGTRAGTWEWNVQTGETVFNRSWAEMIGYELEELQPTSIKTWERVAHPEDMQRSAAMLERHFAGEIAYYECECRLRHKAGHWIWVLDRGRLVSRTESGAPLRMLGSHTDITATKRTQAALQENEERLRTALEAAQMATFERDLSTGRVTWSARHEVMWGYAPGTFDGTTAGFERRVHPDDLPALQAAGERCFASSESSSHEYRIVWPDGTVRWMSSCGRVSRDDSGRPQYLHGVVIDITERKHAEAALQERERQFRSMVESSPVATVLVGFDERIVLLNRRFTELFGYDRNDLSTLGDWWRLAYPDDAYRQQVIAGWKAVIGARGDPVTLVPRERRVTSKSGQVRTVEFTSIVLAEGVLVSLVDLTARKRAEEALRERDAELALAMTQAGLAHWQFDAGSGLLTLNDRFYALYGTTAEREGGYQIPAELYAREFLPEEDRHYVAEEMAKAGIETGQEQWQLEHRIRRRDGAVRHVVVHFARTRDAAGRITGTRGVNQDITARKLAETKLAEQMVELRRWRDVTVGRESRVLELKAEVNQLLAAAGQAPRYASVTRESGAAPTRTAPEGKSSPS